MSLLDSSIAAQNQVGRLLQKISFTTSAGVSALATVTIDDYAAAVPAGTPLVLQADQDFYYEIRKAGATTAVTKLSGARPGKFVPAKQQEMAGTSARDAVIDVIGDSASGNLAVFAVMGV